MNDSTQFVSSNKKNLNKAKQICIDKNFVEDQTKKEVVIESSLNIENYAEDQSAGEGLYLKIIDKKLTKFFKELLINEIMKEIKEIKETFKFYKIIENLDQPIKKIMNEDLEFDTEEHKIIENYAEEQTTEKEEGLYLKN